MGSAARILPFLVHLLYAAFAIASDVLDIPSLVKAADGSTSGFVVGLQTRHGFVRGRGLLREGMLPVSGSVKEVGYFYATLQLGTPSRRFDLIIDTGSTISYVPCKDCKHCGKHKDEAFDVQASKTAVQLACGVPLCDCGSPACQCVNNKCYYSRSYAEQSSSAGFLIEDDFAFPDANGPVKLVFGCESDETGEIFRQVADGILGMGNNNNAFQSQLVAQKVIEDTFGLCFGYPSGGTMLLGEVPLKNKADMKYTALKTGWQVHYYTVTLESIDIEGVPVDVPKTTYAVGYGTVMDSGTTFTYLPSAAFKKFVDMVDKHALSKDLKRTSGGDPQYNDVCWKGAPDDDLHSVFPKMEMVFAPGVRINMAPMQYLFKLVSGSYCLGIFDNQQSGTLVGGISVRNMVVQYDRRNKRIGFLEADCNNIQRAPAEPAQPVQPVPEPTPAVETTPVADEPAVASPKVTKQSQAPPTVDKKKGKAGQKPGQKQGEKHRQEATPGEQGQSAAALEKEQQEQQEQQQEAQPSPSVPKAGPATGDAPAAKPAVSQTQPGGADTEDAAGFEQFEEGVLEPDGFAGSGFGTGHLILAIVIVVIVMVCMQLVYVYRQQLYVFAMRGFGAYASVPSQDKGVGLQAMGNSAAV